MPNTQRNESVIEPIDPQMNDTNMVSLELGEDAVRPPEEDATYYPEFHEETGDPRKMNGRRKPLDTVLR